MPGPPDGGPRRVEGYPRRRTPPIGAGQAGQRSSVQPRLSTARAHRRRLINCVRFVKRHAAAAPIPLAPSEHHAGPGLNTSNTYRPDIDGLRAVAVLPVLFFHAGLGAPGGFVGVDVFFVISGFVITRMLDAEIRDRRFSVLRFYERRIRRLLPAFFAMVAVTTVVAAFLFMPPEFALFGRSLALAALFSSNIGFWSEAGYFDTDAHFKPLLHTWSLGIEEQFYLLFPLLLLGLYRLAPNRRAPALALLVLVSFGLGVRWVVQAPESAFYLLPARAWELGLGSLLALAPAQPIRRPAVATGAAAVGLLLIAAAVFGLSERTPFPGIAALLPCLGTVLLIGAGATPNGVSRALSWSAPVRVGQISYSLYLWHWPVIVFAQQRLGRDLAAGEALAALAVSFAMAVLSWRYVEQPVRHGKRLPARRRVFGAAAMLTAATAAVGAVILQSDGLPGRLPARVLAALAPQQDRSPFFGADCFSDNQTLAAGRPVAGPDMGCAIGDRAAPSPSFAVWGDSHAAAMAPGIDAAASAAGQGGLFLGRGGCPPLIDYDNTSDRAARRAACREHNAAALRIIDDRRIPLVFLVARWPREVLGGENGNEGPFYDPAVPAVSTDRSAPVAAALDATLASLRSPARRVVLVMDVPEPGYDVPLALARAALHGTDARVNPSRSSVEARQALTRDLLQSIAARHGSLIVDPLPAFCDAATCRVEQDGVSRYVDADHLTQGAARGLAPLFRPLFEPALAGGRLARTRGAAVMTRGDVSLPSTSDLY